MAKKVGQITAFEQKEPDPGTFVLKFLALPLKGQEQIKQVLSDINPNYTTGITKAKAILSVEKESYAGKLWGPILHIYWIFNYAHESWVVEAFLPQGGITPQRKLWVDYCPFEMLLDFVPGSFHALNESLKGVEVGGYLKRHLSEVAKLPFDGTVSKEQKGNLRKFILSLPNSLTVENLEEFYNLPKSFNIPRVYYNFNAAVTQEYLNRISEDTYRKLVQS